MFSRRFSRRVRFGFSSTAVYSVEPSSTKQIGTTCGRPSRPTVASRATGAAPASGTEGIGVARPLPDTARLPGLLARDRAGRADGDRDPDAQPFGQPSLEARQGMAGVALAGELGVHLELQERVPPVDHDRVLRRE